MSYRALVEQLLPDNPNEEVVVTKKRLYKETIPSYHCLGGNMDYTTREANYPDLYKVLSNLTKAATWMFWTLMQHRNTNTNICVLQAASQSERVQITRAYKVLHYHALVKRVKQNHYMINPQVIIPINHFQEAKTAWRLLK